VRAAALTDTWRTRAVVAHTPVDVTCMSAVGVASTYVDEVVASTDHTCHAAGTSTDHTAAAVVMDRPKIACVVALLVRLTK
jgi:hypothetical protein